MICHRIVCRKRTVKAGAKMGLPRILKRKGEKLKYLECVRLDICVTIEIYMNGTVFAKEYQHREGKG